MGWGSEKLCMTCGTRGYPKRITRGSILIEIVLWLFMILPGLLYSLWRLSSRRDGCRACGSAELVPLDSPRARAVLAQLAAPPPLP